LKTATWSPGVFAKRAQSSILLVDSGSFERSGSGFRADRDPRRHGHYVEVVRNIPLLVVLYILFLVLPLYGIPINALTAGVLGLAINSTAFTIEIIRAGFAAIPPGQYEAARSLGLHRLQMLRLVIVPQVFRIVLPTLGNQIVSVVLGSAVASIIGVSELTYQTQSIGSSTFRYFELFTITALFYIACVQAISLLWRLLTGRAAHAPLGT